MDEVEQPLTESQKRHIFLKRIGTGKLGDIGSLCYNKLYGNNSLIKEKCNTTE